jgi:hypothetical protein
MADLWITSRERAERLTNAETVRLGRALMHASHKAHVWYRDDQPRATAVIREYTGELSPMARSRVAEVLGDFDLELR